MNKLTTVTLAGILALSLFACAPAQKKEDEARVKCPACGFDFEVPVERH